MDNQEQPKGTEQPEDSRKITRRRFIQNTGFVLGGAVLGGALGGLFKNRQPAAEPGTPGTHAAPGAAEPRNYNRALMFFTPEQFAIVEAATERIFPADETGPGAKALGVPFFIDHQLAGDYGFNGRDYMSPPFFAGEKVQGYQGRLKRREMYEIGLREMENFSQLQYKTSFISLTPEQQDEVLKAFETDTVKLTTISPSGFFKALRGNTIEGTYADPLYGGNLDMAGWKMRNYPGAQMSYTDIIDKDFTKVPPQSLQDHMNH